MNSKLLLTTCPQAALNNITILHRHRLTSQHPEALQGRRLLERSCLAFASLRTPWLPLFQSCQFGEISLHLRKFINIISFLHDCQFYFFLHSSCVRFQISTSVDVMIPNLPVNYRNHCSFINRLELALNFSSSVGIYTFVFNAGPCTYYILCNYRCIVLVLLIHLSVD